MLHPFSGCTCTIHQEVWRWWWRRWRWWCDKSSTINPLRTCSEQGGTPSYALWTGSDVGLRGRGIVPRGGGPLYRFWRCAIHAGRRAEAPPARSGYCSAELRANLTLTAMGCCGSAEVRRAGPHAAVPFTSPSARLSPKPLGNAALEPRSHRTSGGAARLHQSQRGRAFGVNAAPPYKVNV